MSFFNREKHKDTPEEILQDVATIERFQKEGKTSFTKEDIKKQRVPIDHSDEYSEWNDAINRFKIAVDKPVLIVRNEIKAVENGIKSLENDVKTDLKPVETAIKHEWVMLRIPKETRELLKSKQLEGETYAETIKRLANL